MVLILIGIIAAYAAPRLGTVTETNAAAFIDRLRADIRYAQNLAMTENRRYRVYLNSGPAPLAGHAVVNDSNGDGWGVTGAGEYAQDPAGNGSLSLDLTAGGYSGITVGTPGNGAAGYIEFDSIGAAVAGSVTNVRVYANGSAVGSDIVITAQTGAVN